MPTTKFIRTCQECGNQQSAKKPNDQKDLSHSYLNSKCRKCKSTGLDYGSEMDFDEKGNRILHLTGNMVELESEEEWDF